MARQRLTVQEAADHLGTSVDAVRKRVARGSLDSDKGEDGRVYVWLDTDRSERHVEGYALVDVLRDEVSYLREQLSEEREARRRADTIIAQLARTAEEQARTIQALEAPRDEPQDAPGGPQATAEEAERRAHPAPEGPQTASQQPQGTAEEDRVEQFAAGSEKVEPPEPPERVEPERVEPERVEPDRESPEREQPERAEPEDEERPLFANEPPPPRRRGLLGRLFGR